MPCDLRLPIITQWSSADPSPLQPFFSILRPACCGGGGVPLSLGRVIARFQLFSSHLWLALHQIRSSGYPPCPDTPAQPLSRRTPLLVGWRRAVFLLATPAFRLSIILRPLSLPCRSRPQYKSGASTHTHVSNIQLAECLLRFCLAGSFALVAAARRVLCVAVSPSDAYIHSSATLYHSSTASLPSVQPPMLHMPTSPDDPASTASPHRRRRILCTYLYIRNDAQMAHASPRPETSLRYRPNAPLQTTRTALARRIHTAHTRTKASSASPPLRPRHTASSLLLVFSVARCSLLVPPRPSVGLIMMMNNAPKKSAVCTLFSVC